MSSPRPLFHDTSYLRADWQLPQAEHLRVAPDSDRHPSVSLVVDEATYEMSNICGALLPESFAVLSAQARGAPVAEVREGALSGAIFHQPSRQARRRFWHAVHARYLAHGIPWIISDLAHAAARGPHDPTALGLLYLHFVLRDHLTRDWILGPVCSRWNAGQRRLVRDDVLADISNLLRSTPQAWTEGSQKKLATSLLSALRDFGLAHGVQLQAGRRERVLQ